LPSIRSFFEAVNVVSHTSRWERLLRKHQIQSADPTEKIQINPYIWNVCVIDNIDFEEATYEHGNIYNKTLKTFHATLHVIFQFTLPQQIGSITNNNNNNNEDEMELDETTCLIGDNFYSKAWLGKVNNVIRNLITSKQHTLDDDKMAGINPDDVHMELLKDITIGCKVPKPNIIILEPGEAPNSNENIEKVCFTYFDDLNITNEDNN